MNNIKIWTGEKPENGQALILPNGYGYLGYIDGVKNELIKHSSKVYLPILSGQNGNKGTLTIKQAVSDLKEQLRSIVGQVVVICHCSSLIVLNEIKSKSFWAKVSEINLYSFLADPQRHYERFMFKARKYGVKMEQDISALHSYFDCSVYENIPKQIRIIHPKTKMNRLRATSSELKEMSKLKNVVSLEQPDIGYEIDNNIQTEETKFIVRNFFRKSLIQ